MGFVKGGGWLLGEFVSLTSFFLVDKRTEHFTFFELHSAGYWVCPFILDSKLQMKPLYTITCLPVIVICW